MNMCHFSELIRANRNQVSERVVGSAGLRGGDNSEGVGVARQVAGSGVKRVKQAIVHPPGNVRE